MNCTRCNNTGRISTGAICSCKLGDLTKRMIALSGEIKFDEGLYGEDSFIGLYLGIEEIEEAKVPEMVWDSYKGFARTSGPWRLLPDQARALRDALDEYLSIIEEYNQLIQEERFSEPYIIW